MKCFKIKTEWVFGLVLVLGATFVDGALVQWYTGWGESWKHIAYLDGVVINPAGGANVRKRIPILAYSEDNMIEACSVSAAFSISREIPGNSYARPPPIIDLSGIHFFPPLEIS